MEEQSQAQLAWPSSHLDLFLPSSFHCCPWGWFDSLPLTFPSCFSCGVSMQTCHLGGCAGRWAQCW